MNVVEFPQTDLRDIALQLRRMADWIEKADYREMSCIVILGMPSQAVNVYGWGARTSGLEMQGWLARATSSVAGEVERFQESGG
jgi:hypothetical protein